MTSFCAVVKSVACGKFFEFKKGCRGELFAKPFFAQSFCCDLCYSNVISYSDHLFNECCMVHAHVRNNNFNANIKECITKGFHLGFLETNSTKDERFNRVVFDDGSDDVCFLFRVCNVAGGINVVKSEDAGKFFGVLDSCEVE